MNKQTNPIQRIAELEAKVASAEEELAQVQSQLKNDPDQTVKHHIQLLHEYNEIKDIGQALIGKYAELNNMTVKEAYKEFNVDTDD